MFALIRRMVRKCISVAAVLSARIDVARSRARSAAAWEHDFDETKWRLLLKKLGDDPIIRRPVYITFPEMVEMGDRVRIESLVRIQGRGGVTLGNDVLIGPGSIISSETHSPDVPLFRPNLETSPVVIEDNVWLGAGVIVLPGVRIGTGSVLAAGSVVTADVPPKSLFAGVPAHLKRKLDPSLRGRDGK